MPYTDRIKKLEYAKKWNKNHYLTHKKEEYLRIKKRRDDIRKWFTDLKSTLRCEICGESESVCLDFHHKNKQKKELNFGFLKSGGYGKSRIEKELKKCVVLCANCHRKIHAKII